VPHVPEWIVPDIGTLIVPDIGTLIDMATRITIEHSSMSAFISAAQRHFRVTANLFTFSVSAGLRRPGYDHRLLLNSPWALAQWFSMGQLTERLLGRYISSMGKK
jgi:hypothetical protein